MGKGFCGAEDPPDPPARVKIEFVPVHADAFLSKRRLSRWTTRGKPNYDAIYGNDTFVKSRTGMMTRYEL